MNTFQSELYANLLKLTQERDSFSTKDFQQNDGTILRIFQYRLSSYSDFLEPGAMNARGTMYHVAADDSPLELLALPMEKFFGVDENPMSMKLDLSPKNIRCAMNKLDGSLISSYRFGGELKLKSKAHIYSTEVRAAMALLNSTEYAPMKTGVDRLTERGFTVDMEYTGPENRIVLAYDTAQLSILSVRNRNTGDTFLLEEVCTPQEYEQLRPYEAKVFEGKELEALLATIDAQQQLEGLVLWLKAGKYPNQRVKLKALPYVTLHKACDAISAIETGGIRDPRKLYDCVLYEVADELKSMYVNRADVLEMLAAIEAQVLPKFNAMVATVEGFYEANKHLDAKSFSLKAQQEAKPFMQLLMTKYRGQAFTYLMFALKNVGMFCSADVLKPTTPVREEVEVEAEA
jgi:T4 RnlA family RNA ligase